LLGQSRSNALSRLHAVGPRLRYANTVAVAAGQLQGRETLFKPFQRCDSFTVTKRILGDGMTPACDVREDGLTVDPQKLLMIANGRLNQRFFALID
jgi:hypothetical protein